MNRRVPAQDPPICPFSRGLGAECIRERCAAWGPVRVMMVREWCHLPDSCVCEPVYNRETREWDLVKIDTGTEPFKEGCRLIGGEVRS